MKLAALTDTNDASVSMRNGELVEAMLQENQTFEIGRTESNYGKR